MSAAVSKAGPYYTSGSISFSSLRQNFREQQPDGSFPGDSASISASQLLRSETKTTTHPIIPDCTENRTSGPLGLGITTGNNLSISQFRNSIKYYYLTQSGTNDNVATPSSPGFDIDAQSWNSNLNRNIHKILYVNGTIGSVHTNQPASHLNTETHNLVIDISGSILGAGGTGGSGISTTGENGGTALSINPGASGSNVVIKINTGAKIYGGGGGGEKGKTGANGSKGNCFDAFTNPGGCNCPGCPSGWTNGGCSQNYGNHCDRKQVCNNWGNCWWESNGDSYSNYCYKNYEVLGGSGGSGGNGGLGRGYNNQSGSLLGAPGGSGGSYQSCYDGGSYTTVPTIGDDGGPGASGGEWAQPGDNTLNTGAGGTPGRAIFGSNYTVTGIINSDTIKGSYTAS